VVFHGSDLTIAFAVPGRHTRDGRKSDEIYRGIHLAILKVVQEAFLEVRLAGEDDCRPGAACFQSPALHDILFRGKKICGGALRRGRAGTLYQGSLHADLLPADLAAALSTPVAGFSGGAEESPRPEFLPACDPPTDSGTSAEAFTPDVETLRLCATLAEEKYGTEKWNEMR
jgi:lipoate-protein ligase A